ncbi:MAG: glycosyltransferase family 4 protein [Luteolibacter sp.]
MQPLPHILLMGQTPPPWHGQAVATQILFEHDWTGFDVHRLRMEFSEEMQEVGRFHLRKIAHLFHLIREARKTLGRHPGCILFYPPASAKWVPFLRDVIFLISVRHLAGATVFIYHASGLPVFVQKDPIRSILARLAYGRAEMALEVAEEKVPPHRAFDAIRYEWCPCGIEVPALARSLPNEAKPLESLFVGSLQEGKGVLEIIKTAAILKDKGQEKNFHFRIVGKWFSKEFQKETEALRRELAVESMVELVGELTGDDKWQAYRDADVFFFPTHYASEATPIVLMEALGAGLSLLTTKWAGIPAMLDGCGSARLCDTRSPEQYAEALLALRAEPDLRIRNDEVSRAFYRRLYRPESFIQRVRNAFEEVAALRQPATSLKSATLARALEESVLPTGSRHNAADTIHPLRLTIYLADQNPGYDRSFGISRMSHVVMGALKERCRIDAVVSRTSQRPPADVRSIITLPWGTRRKWVRFLTDHLHPLFHHNGLPPDVHYFPKGYLPWLHMLCRPSVVTIHDTIILYDADHYPRWRRKLEYYYWALMLKHTLLHADRIMTVSETSKRQIEAHMDRLMIPHKPVKVTYEPCAYESLPQPVNPAKRDYVLHLASVEPHKRTAQLIRWWHEAELAGKALPELHLVGAVPHESVPVVAASKRIVKHPFLEDSRLRDAYQEAKMLILPSEIEGFGLPALEAYYLGTPVCYVKGTSVEEVLAPATIKGGFTLDTPASLWAAMAELGQMSADEVHACGLKLRETYAAEKVAERMMEVFEEVRQQQGEDAQR